MRCSVLPQAGALGLELEDHDVVLAEGAAAETYGGDLAMASTTPRSMRDCMAQRSGPSETLHPSPACSAVARS